MTELIIETFTCRDCKREFPRRSPRGRKPSQCAECRVEDCRRRAREQHERIKSGYTPATTYVCVDCKGEFPRQFTVGQIPLRCEPCWTASEAQRARRRSDEKMAELRKIFETEGRWTACEVCDVDIRCRSQKGAAPRWCKPCRLARRRQADQRLRPWMQDGLCIECGGPADLETQDARRRLCEGCMSAQRDEATGQWLSRISPERREAALKYGLSATRLRGAWDDQYTNLEIFQRDRWICQICLAPVDQALRRPHAMAASADHVIPRTQGGIDCRAGVRLAHLACNSARGNRGGNEQLALVG